MNTNITHIGKLRTEGIANPILVQYYFKISEIEYKQLVYDLGLKFLNEVYQDDQEMISILERSIFYWKWWKAEFLVWENVGIEYMQSNKIDGDKNYYTYIMDNLTTHSETFQGFENFIKIYAKKIHLEASNKQVINK